MVSPASTAAPETPQTPQVEIEQGIIKLPGGIEFKAPILTGTEGQKALDITKLRLETGVTTLDRAGFGNTAIPSSITFIEGGKGILHHLGYPIQKLVQEQEFLNVAYLLLHGELPNAEQSRGFKNLVRTNQNVDPELLTSIQHFPKKRPMANLQAAVALLGTYHEELNINNSKGPIPAEQKELAVASVLGKMPILVAAIHNAAKGKELVIPTEELTYAEFFLQMMHLDENGARIISATEKAFMDRALTLHTDHEQNCSTTTGRTVISSGATLSATLSAAIGALSGAAHGGANEEVLRMFDAIVSEGTSVDAFISRAETSKEVRDRLMGFGHRVYKNKDPRAKALQELLPALLAEKNPDDPRFKIATDLEAAARSREYFIEKRLFPNVDFYSGIGFSAMGFPREELTLLFALGRSIGWTVHAFESAENKTPITRPWQVYTGPSMASRGIKVE